METKPIEITAVFIGKDGSCGFRNGETYKLWLFQIDGRYYLSKRNMNSIAIPYDTMAGLKKNWRIISW